MSRRTIALMALVAMGLGLLLYPTAANWFAVRSQNAELTGYASAVATMPTSEQNTMLAHAEQYNTNLSRGLTGVDSTTYAEYVSHLSPQPGDVMAEVTIPALRITLPVYHGTGEDSLQRGVGHLFGTSLPVGGTGTHTVLSAHSGLVGADLFTRLGTLEEGDLFSIDVVGRTLVYEIDHIAKVTPEDSSELERHPDQDYATLLTCTPTGVNTHRLLVRGHRVDPVSAEQTDQVIGGRNVDAGFPWWAAAWAGGTAAMGLIGRAIDRPKKRAAHTDARRRPDSQAGRRTDA